MVGAPSIVSVVDPAAMITAIFIVQWLLGAVGGLSIPHHARSCQDPGFIARESTWRLWSAFNWGSSGGHAGSTAVAGSWNDLIYWDSAGRI